MVLPLVGPVQICQRVSPRREDRLTRCDLGAVRAQRDVWLCLSAVKNGSQSLDIFHAPINRSIQHLTGGKSDYTLPLILEEDWEGIKLKLNQQGKAKIRRSEFLAVSEACKALEIYGENR